jgi:hypothetical protein
MSYFIIPLFEPDINLFPICYFIPLLILWLAKTLNQGITIGDTTTHTHTNWSKIFSNQSFTFQKKKEL